VPPCEFGQYRLRVLAVPTAPVNTESVSQQIDHGAGKLFSRYTTKSAHVPPTTTQQQGAAGRSTNKCLLHSLALANSVDMGDGFENRSGISSGATHPIITACLQSLFPPSQHFTSRLVVADNWPVNRNSHSSERKLSPCLHSNTGEGRLWLTLCRTDTYPSFLRSQLRETRFLQHVPTLSLYSRLALLPAYRPAFKPSQNPP
jgi:hypothetical protein